MSEQIIRRIPYTRPSITELEVKYAVDAARHGWGEHCYDYIARFEDAFKTHLGVRYAIATSSCTGALHMGMHALGIGPGDEVIMADTNWIATAAPIIHLGATPVFVDILPDSWCLDPDQVEAAITPKTKAIVAVHLYGNLCEMNTLLAIGEKHGIPVIEDAAEAIGSVYYGKRAGSMGLFGAFSFHGTKTIATGEGGMFVTNNPVLYEHVLTLSNHGRVDSEVKQFWPKMIGFKYKMSNIQAAIGCAQMERIDSLIGVKRAIFLRYKNLLKGLPIRMNTELVGCTNGYWMPTVVCEEDVAFEREYLISEMNSNGVDARVFFGPISSMSLGGRKAFKKQYRSENIYLRAINLPSPHDLTDEDASLIANLIKFSINKKFTINQ